MKRYKVICINCLKEDWEQQIEGLPIPHNDLMTKGLLPIPEPGAGWIRCNILREHTFVNKKDYVEGRIHLDGKAIKPKPVHNS